MKKSIILFLFLKIIFYNKIAIGDIFFDLDLLPIDKQANIIKINFSKSSKLFSENLNTSKNISSNKFNVGFNFGKKRNLFYDLDVNDNDFNSKFKLNNYQQKNYKTKITLIYPFNNFGESEIIRGFSFRFGMEDTNQFLCLESNLSVYGISNTNCNLPGKTFHQFEQDDKKGFILSYNRKIFGIDTFIKKVDYNWLGKNSFSLGINSSLVQNDLRLNKQLVLDHPNVKNIVPQSQDWIKITLNPKYSLTRKLGKGWSFGNSYNLFMTNSINYNQNNKIPKFNSKIEANLSKKLYDNSFISFGGFLSNNYKVGFDDLAFNNLNSELYNQSYSEVFLSFGTILNKPIDYSLSDDKDIISQINNEILFANDNKSNNIIPNNEIKKTKITLQKNQTTDNKNNLNYGNKRFKIRIDKTKLILYALNFAKDYDNIDLN